MERFYRVTRSGPMMAKLQLDAAELIDKKGVSELVAIGMLIDTHHMSPQDIKDSIKKIVPKEDIIDYGGIERCYHYVQGYITGKNAVKS